MGGQPPVAVAEERPEQPLEQGTGEHQSGPRTEGDHIGDPGAAVVDRVDGPLVPLAAHARHRRLLTEAPAGLEFGEA